MSLTFPSQELRGKSIISVTNGEVVGRVVDVLIDPLARRVGALVTSKGGFLSREIKAMPGQMVQVWGQDVILVSRPDVIAKKEELPDHEKWMSSADRIKGHDVIGTDGRRIGQLSDVVLDSQGQIVAYELSQTGYALTEILGEDATAGSSRRIPVAATHSFGRDVLIIDVSQLLAARADRVTAAAEELAETTAAIELAEPESLLDTDAALPETEPPSEAEPQPAALFEPDRSGAPDTAAAGPFDPDEDRELTERNDLK